MPQPKQQQQPAGSGVPLSYIPPAAAYETAYKIIDPEVMFHNRISRLLFNAQYVKSNAGEDSSL